MVRLPSRYEDLDEGFRGRLRPIPALLELIQRARNGMSVNGGIRFVPIFGRSGSGKSSAAREIGTHMPEVSVLTLSRDDIESLEYLRQTLSRNVVRTPLAQVRVAVIDQYEEVVAAKEEVPSRFVEWLSLIDRDSEFNRHGWVFVWLTTSRAFRDLLVAATTRNRRVLLAKDFEISGPPKADWGAIIEDTFEFHNGGKPLADFGLLPADVHDAVVEADTIGATIESIGQGVGARFQALQDISAYQVVMLWPVTDGQRISTLLRFVDGREGYRLDWNAWYRELNEVDRLQLPLAAFNRARLYFDVRLVPVAAADLEKLCVDLDAEAVELHASYLERFAATHYHAIVAGSWDPGKYSPLRERESKRAENARKWYASVTAQPTKVGRRLAMVLQNLGLRAKHEEEIVTTHGRVRADVLSHRPGTTQTKVITELKVYSPENTMPSTIRDAVRTTLRRHAQLAGFLQRQ